MRRAAFALVALLCFAPASTLAADARQLSSQIDQAAQSAYRNAGQKAPLPDATLARAASILAEKALKQGLAAATDAGAVQEALSVAGAWDPPPRVVVVRASPPERSAQAIANRADLASTPATHEGSAVAVGPELAAAVLLLSERKAELAPFPRRVDVGTSARLTGKLLFPLHSARIFVTPPSGKAKQVQAEAPGSGRFDQEVRFPSSGTWTVEVVADSVKGPEVVAIFQVIAGAPSKSAEADLSVVPEKKDLNKALDQVLVAINGRRKAQGVQLLSRSALLDSVAAEHAEEMVRLNYFAHVSPVSGDVGQRLAKAGFSYEKVGENLGEASSALEAHRGIESSPGHLANVLDPDVDLVGLAATRVRRGSIDNVILVEVFARGQQAVASASPENLSQAVNVARQRHGLKALPRDGALERFAGEEAARLAKSGSGLSAASSSIARRAVEGLQLQSAAVDLFVTAAVPSDVPESKNFSVKDFDRQGVGIARGPLGPRGEPRYLVVLIYGSGGGNGAP